jgi:hypothetical protein
MSIAGIALKMILMTGMFPSDPMGFLKAALTAGLGSPALMRSKWLKITISGKETAIGPEIIINIFLETLEKRIDRSRAIDRKKLVEDCMADIDFKKAKAYTVTTVIAASQTDTAEAVKNVIDESEKIAGSQMEDEEKSLALGYLVLDKMGEKFLSLLFHDKNRGKYTRKSQP